MIEEFMLLANRRVATTLAASFPDRALLRRHPPPDARKLAELAAFSAAHGLSLECSAAGALAASLKALRAARPDAVPLATLLATKPQQLAQYFCTGQLVRLPMHCVLFQGWRVTDALIAPHSAAGGGVGPLRAGDAAVYALY